MDNPVFDAASFVKFDLDAGLISSIGEEQLALVPGEVLRALKPGMVLDSTARNWGLRHGKRLAAQVAEMDRAAGIEMLAEHLGGTAAVLGMGRVSVELRADALMFRARSKNVSEGGSALLAGFLAGYLSALSEYDFEVLCLGKDRGDQLFWAGNQEAATKVRLDTSDGEEPLTAIGRLARRSK